MRYGEHPKKVWSRVQARSGQASAAAWQRSCHAVAQDLGVHESVLRRWLKEYGSGPADKGAERPLKNVQTQEIERLKRELARVKMERDIIKKALGYFAKDPS